MSAFKARKKWGHKTRKKWRHVRHVRSKGMKARETRNLVHSTLGSLEIHFVRLCKINK